jgi:hypothetical protein
MTSRAASRMAIGASSDFAPLATRCGRGAGPPAHPRLRADACLWEPQRAMSYIALSVLPTATFHALLTLRLGKRIARARRQDRQRARPACLIGPEAAAPSSQRPVHPSRSKLWHLAVLPLPRNHLPPNRLPPPGSRAARKPRARVARRAPRTVPRRASVRAPRAAAARLRAAVLRAAAASERLRTLRPVSRPRPGSRDTMPGRHTPPGIFHSGMNFDEQPPPRTGVASVSRRSRRVPDNEGCVSRVPPISARSVTR